MTKATTHDFRLSLTSEGNGYRCGISVEAAERITEFPNTLAAVLPFGTVYDQDESFNAIDDNLTGLLAGTEIIIPLEENGFLHLVDALCVLLSGTPCYTDAGGPGANHTPFSAHWVGASIRPHIVLRDRRGGARRAWPGILGSPAGAAPVAGPLFPDQAKIAAALPALSDAMPDVDSCAQGLLIAISVCYRIPVEGITHQIAGGTGNIAIPGCGQLALVRLGRTAHVAGLFEGSLYDCDEQRVRTRRLVSEVT
eukprot:2188385-Amphidinium_carterae.1